MRNFAQTAQQFITFFKIYTICLHFFCDSLKNKYKKNIIKHNKVLLQIDFPKEKLCF